MSEGAEPLLKIREVAAICSVSVQTIRRWTDAGKFPKPIQLGGRTRRWHRAEVERFIEEAGQ